MNPEPTTISSDNYILCSTDQNDPYSFVMLSKPQKVLAQIFKSKFPLIVCLHDQQQSIYLEQLHQIRDSLGIPFECVSNVDYALEKIMKEANRQIIFLFPVAYEEDAQIVKRHQSKLVALICYNSDSGEYPNEGKGIFGKLTYYTKSKNQINNFLKVRKLDEYQRKSLPNFVSMKGEVLKSNILIQTNILMENLHLSDKSKHDVLTQLQLLLDKLEKEMPYYTSDQSDRQFFSIIKQRSMTITEAIKWYTKQSFLYRLLNLLLRASVNPCSTFYLQPYYKELSTAIKQLYRNQQARQRLKDFECYRGGQISVQQLEFLKNNQGSIVQNLGFLSASKDKSTAYSFSQNVFFVIKVNVHKRQSLFQNGYAELKEWGISQKNYQNEVLFHPLCSFKILSVKETQDQAAAYTLVIEMEYGEVDRILAKKQEELNEQQNNYKNLALSQLQMRNNMKDNRCQGHLLIRSYFQQSLVYWDEFLKMKLCTKDKVEGLFKKTQSLMRLLLLKQLQGPARQVNKLALQQYGESSIEYAKTQFILGWNCLNMQKYDQALDLLSECDKIFKDVEGEGSQDYLINYQRLGQVYYMKGQYNKSQQIFNKCLDFRRKYMKNSSQYYSSVLKNIGHSYLVKNEFEKALEYLEQAANSLNKTQTNNFGLDTILHEIGYIHEKQQRYEKAIDKYQKSMCINISTRSYINVNYANALNNISGCYRILHKFDKALKYLQRAYDIYLRLFGPDRIQVQIAETNLGIIYYQMDRNDEAIQIMEKLKEPWSQSTGFNRYYYLQYLNYLSKLYLKVNKLEQGLQTCEKLQVVSKQIGQKSLDLAQGLLTKGMILKSMHKRDESLKLLQASKQMLESIAAKNHKLYSKINEEISQLQK